MAKTRVLTEAVISPMVKNAAYSAPLLSDFDNCHTPGVYTLTASSAGVWPRGGVFAGLLTVFSRNGRFVQRLLQTETGEEWVRLADSTGSPYKDWVEM